MEWWLEASNGLPKLSIGTSNSNEVLLEASNAHHWRKVTGILRGYDPFTNLVLDNTVDIL